MTMSGPLEITSAMPVLPEIAEEAASRIFTAGHDAMEDPFTPAIQRRGLLFPIGRALEREEFCLLVERAVSEGADGAFASWWGHPNQHWLVTAKDVGAYRNWVDDPHAVYSPAGTWGVLTSVEDHAVFGGSDEFYDWFVDRTGHDVEREAEAFAREFLWPENPATNWLEPSLVHLFGPERAQELLRLAQEG